MATPVSPKPSTMPSRRNDTAVHPGTGAPAVEGPRSTLLDRGGGARRREAADNLEGEPVARRLLGRSLNDMAVQKQSGGGPGKAVWWDKVPSEVRRLGRNAFARTAQRGAGLRGAPSAIHRAQRRADEVLVNLASYVDSGTMVDYRGERVCPARKAARTVTIWERRIGGVLEPLQGAGDQ